jgi:hypothetical protein
VSKGRAGLHLPIGICPQAYAAIVAKFARGGVSEVGSAEGSRDFDHAAAADAALDELVRMCDLIQRNAVR